MKSLILCAVLLTSACFAAGPYGHVVIAQQVMGNIRDGGAPAPELLKEALEYPDCRLAFCGGAIGPDISESKTHYGKTGDLARQLINSARAELIRAKHAHNDQAIAEARIHIAFAYGWLTHCATDLTVHPKVNSIVGDTFRFCAKGQQLLHGAQESQMSAYLKLKTPGVKFDYLIPYDFMSKIVGVERKKLVAGVVVLRSKTMAELIATDNVTLPPAQLQRIWGGVAETCRLDSLRFIADPNLLENWDLDCGRISTDEFNRMRTMAIQIMEGKLPKEWGAKYLSWYAAIKDLPSDQQREKLANILRGEPSKAKTEPAISLIDTLHQLTRVTVMVVARIHRTDQMDPGSVYVPYLSRSITDTSIHWDGLSFSVAGAGSRPGQSGPYKGMVEMHGTLSPDGRMVTALAGKDTYKSYVGDRLSSEQNTAIKVSNVPYFAKHDWGIEFKLEGPAAQYLVSELLDRDIINYNPPDEQNILSIEWANPNFVPSVSVVFNK